MGNIEGKIKWEECVDMDVESIGPFDSGIRWRRVRRRRKEDTISEEPVRFVNGGSLDCGVNLTTTRSRIQLPQEVNPGIP